MKKNQLDHSDLYVAPLTFGGNVFGWTIDEPTSFEILDAFVAAGYNFIDTANAYSRWVPGNKGGESETIIGNWMKSRRNRDQVIIATKVGADMGEGKSLRKNDIFKEAEASLKRLQTDYIDLYQSHWDDSNTPVEETLSAYADLVQQGKVRWIGASNFSAERLSESLAASKKHHYPSYQTFQPLYNLYDRAAFEKELQQVCKDNNIGVINYYALASGFLTGKYRDESDWNKSVRGQGMKAYFNQRGRDILTALDHVAAIHHTAPASIALAWLLTRPTVAAPIASATSITQLQDLINANNIVLSQDDIALLDAASAWE